MTPQTTLVSEDSLNWESSDYSIFFGLAKEAEFIAVDTETTGINIRDGRDFAVGISVSFLPGYADAIPVSAYFPFRHKFGINLDQRVLAQLKELIEEHETVVFHNSKFDLVSLATLGIHRTKKFYCTMLMAHWTNENLFSKSLDSLAKLLLNDEGKKKSPEFLAVKKAIGWQGIPSSIMAPYAAYDTDMTARLFVHLRPTFNAEGYEETLWPIEQDFLRLILKMEHRGVRIDTGLAEQQAYLGNVMLGEIAEDLGFNPGSNKQLGEFFIDELQLPVVKDTPAGKPSFDREAMVEYDEMLSRLSNDRAKLVQQYRGWQKAVTSNYEPYVRLLSPDGRLRPNYKLHGTKTGRMSCEEPNLQQIPRVSDKPWNGRMKDCFIPEDGYVLIEADYSQLEFRLGSAYARERGLLEVFADPERDIFTEMSRQLDMERQDVKTLVYTISYGGGVKRIKNVFGISPAKASELRENFYESYPGFREITNLASNKCRSQRYVTLWSGRRRHFSYPKDEAHKAFNSAIQGGAAEIVKRTMLRLDREVDSDDCRMLLQVHDSVVFEVRETMRDEYESRIKSCMEAVSPDFGVKFRVDVHQWGH